MAPKWQDESKALWYQNRGYTPPERFPTPQHHRNYQGYYSSWYHDQYQDQYQNQRDTDETRTYQADDEEIGGVETEEEAAEEDDDKILKFCARDKIPRTNK